VGGVSGRAGAKAGGSNPFAFLSFACRDGRRHPGFPEGGALRGASSERRSWSARFRSQRLPPRRAHAPMTADVRRSPRRGTPSAYATQGVGTGRRHETSSHAHRRRVLRSVLRPVLVNPHYASSGSNRRWWGALGGIAAGQTCASGKNQHRGHRGGRSAARRASLPERAAWCVRKGRWSRPPSLRGRRAQVWLPARRSAVAEVVGRRLTSNKLGKRAPKRAAGPCERGSSSKRTAVAETIVG
jgi:hypothetical protein